MAWVTLPVATLTKQYCKEVQCNSKQFQIGRITLCIVSKVSSVLIQTVVSG